MRIVTACASALALAISIPALSQGQGNGNDPRAERGQNNGNAARDNRGNRPDRTQKHNNRGRADFNRSGSNADRGDRGNGNAGRGRSARQSAARARGNNDNRNRGRGSDDRADRERNDRAGALSRGNDRGANRRAARNAGDIVERRTRNLRAGAQRAANRQRLVELRDRRDRRGERRGRNRDFNNDFYRERRWTDDAFHDRIVHVRNRQRSAWQSRFCPPGLARQNELCMPPGQYRKLYNHGRRFDRAGYAVPDWYRVSYGANPFYGLVGQAFDYRYADGYAYRVDPETQLITALLPVIGGALGLGQTLPVGYNVYNLPMQYRSVYRDDDYHYRYGDGAIYRVDPADRTILGISELLTPGFTVGRPLPAGYDVYNVPHGYRDTYYDSDEYLYRYNNGRIHQVDPETRLVLAAIDLLV